jgi:hypothetical protein
MLQITGTCEQFQIDDYQQTALKFMRDILGISPENCFLSDESDLDEFSLMGDELDTGNLSWDDFIINKIHAKYGIALTTTRVNLVTLFNQIEQASAVVYH